MVSEILQFLFRFGGFLGHISPNDINHRPNPQRDRPWAEARHLSYKAWISAARFELGVGTTKKDSTGQEKSHKGYISPIWAESLTEAICIKNCLVVVGDVLDVIMCAKFQNEIVSGYDFTGVEFSYWFLNGPCNSAVINRADYSSELSEAKGRRGADRPGW